jgi:hypothetical protein
MKNTLENLWNNSINLKTITLTMVGIQVIMIICMYALLWRVSTIESIHEEPTQIKK